MVLVWAWISVEYQDEICMHVFEAFCPKRVKNPLKSA